MEETKEYTNNDPVATVSIGKAKRCIHALDTQGFTNEDAISFEFLVGSLFPDIYDQVTERIRLAYTQGYIDGATEREEDNYDFS